MPSKFQPTRWSLIQNATDPDVRSRNRAWTEFDHLYRTPLLRFISRSGWPNDRAEDLLQTFLAIVAERDWLAEADRERGKMRTFLLTRLKRHLNDVRKHDRAEKRGGKVETLSLEEETERSGREPTGPGGAEGDAESMSEFDREWARSILDHTLAGLQARAESKGQEHVFRILQGQITGNSEEKLRDAAKTLGESEGAVRMKLQRLREEFRKRLRAEVAETLLPGEDVSEELRYLARVLAQ